MKIVTELYISKRNHFDFITLIFVSHVLYWLLYTKAIDSKMTNGKRNAKIERESQEKNKNACWKDLRLWSLECCELWGGWGGEVFLLLSNTTLESSPVHSQAAEYSCWIYGLLKTRTAFIKKLFWFIRNSWWKN